MKSRVRFRLTGADITNTISRAVEMGVSIYDIEYCDLLSACMWVRRFEWSIFLQIARKRGDTVSIISESGVGLLLRQCGRRAVLITFAILLLVLTIWIPSRVLFISVQGNENVSTERILQQAEISGIYFGAERKLLRSESTKNRLVESLPELSWVGVNTSGCNAVIQVKERKQEPKEAELCEASNIVSIHDGIITELTVLSGNAECKVGDAVKRDQVLISGYQNLGTIVKLTRSRGEIYGKTKREISLLAPKLLHTMATDSATEVNYGIVIGKNRIKLSNCSGISYSKCDKIYKEYFVVLPGGFVLPISLTCEYIYEPDKNLNEAPQTQELIMDYADSYLLDQTVSGRIISKTYSVEEEDLFCSYNVLYECVEMIGREQLEAYQFDYGKND